MGRDFPGRDRQRRGEPPPGDLAYLTDDRVPAEERGRAILALLAHAGFFLLLTAADAAWVIAVAVRVWRRRDRGWAAAARSGVHRPTLVALLAGQVAYVVFRRAIRARIRAAGVRSAQAVVGDGADGQLAAGTLGQQRGQRRPGRP